MNFIISPLEQFQIYPLVPIRIGPIDISVTNQVIILAVILMLLLVFVLSLTVKSLSLRLFPTRWQSTMEIIHSMVMSLVVDNIKSKEGQYFFPLVSAIFTFVLSMNLIGLVPFSFTVTSHILVTFALSLAVFIGINIICVKKHGIKFFCLFLPAGTSVTLALLLVPIEFISYMFKPISLSIRLFANMMAGHMLLKVIAGFAFTLMANVGILFLVHFFPLLILIPLFLLELGVALIQAFVFSILICIYLSDSINLH